MIRNFLEFSKQIHENNLQFTNHKLNEVVKEFTFFRVSNLSDIEDNQKIQENIKESKVITIDCYKEKNQQDTFFIICFNQSLLIIDQLLISLLQPFFLNISNIPIFFSTNSKQIFNEQIKIKNEQFEIEKNFFEEISSFKSKFNLKAKSKNNSNLTSYFQIFNIIKESLAAYLVIQSYFKLNEKQQNINFSSQDQIEITRENMNENECINLKVIGNGSSSTIELIYHIEKGELFAVKKQNENYQENSILLKREIENYTNINYPLLPKMYGLFIRKYLVIQFINGQILSDIEKIQLNETEKLKIIFELMMSINYLHKKGFVYRDLKPSNIIIDENKNAFIIDFDRMIKYTDKLIDEVNTNDFSSSFVAPEVNLNEISFKNDIYSIGQIIYFIILEKYPNKKDEFENNSPIQKIYKICTSILLEKRPSISELMFIFYSFYESKIKNQLILNDPDVEYINGILHYKQDIVKKDANKAINFLSIASDLDNISTQHTLGMYYLHGGIIKQDIKKAIHYLSLAANQNHAYAQSNLGMIYFYFEMDIEKAIHYLSLASNQNVSDAQYLLGKIYEKGEHVPNDLDKAFYYFSLAADQNHSDALFHLGQIYHQKNNIEKAKYYYELAANQNNANAQLSLGYIYYRRNNIEKSRYYFGLAVNDLTNIPSLFFYFGSKLYKEKDKRFIECFTFSAELNYPEAQYSLGVLYHTGKYVEKDINKSIYYLTLAANQNFSNACYYIGEMFYEGDQIEENINKAIYYLTIAANKNHPVAQFKLGYIFLKGKKAEKDLKKAIYYFTLSANQNNANAQFNLGIIYYSKIRDFDKAIYYFTLSSNCEQLMIYSHNYLGNIYFLQKNINKSIYYFTLAANKNDAVAQFNLGIIYYSEIKDFDKAIYYFNLTSNCEQYMIYSHNFLGKIYFLQKNINKSIYYFTLAAKKNEIQSQVSLGWIYYDGLYVPKDIKRAIYYFKLAADQNDVESQRILGTYYSLEDNPDKDINKAIYYLTLASNRNDSEAQYNLAAIYLNGVENDIKKAIYYMSLSSKNGNDKAHYFFCSYYYDNIFTKRDTNKVMYYLTLAANKNNAKAQYFLGFFYITGHLGNKININKGINLLLCSSSNGHINASFYLGFLYQQGKYVHKDIRKSIKYYKMASSFDDYCAKNNLGIIYKNEIVDDNIPKYGIAISYFEESARIYNDKVSMYNLSHIYIYVDKSKEKIDESIRLLIKSTLLDFFPSQMLLSIALILNYKFHMDKIKQILIDQVGKSSNLPNEMCYFIEFNNFFYDESEFDRFYQTYEKYDFIYVYNYEPRLSSCLNKKKKKNVIFENQKDITSDFYEGFYN